MRLILMSERVVKLNKLVGVIGASVMDVMVQGCSGSLLDVSSTPVKAIRISTGGDALNEAVLLARLGADVHLHTLLGSDKAGEFLRQAAIREGISLHAAADVFCSPVNVVLCDEQGERHFLTDAGSALRKLSLSHIDELSEDIVVLASMFVSHALSINDVTNLFAQLKRENRITCMDMTTPKFGEKAGVLSGLLPYVDYLFCNREEGSLLCGSTDPDIILNTLCSCGAHTVLLKDGGSGVHVLDHGRIFHVPAVLCSHVVSTNGCGDAFGAGFIYGLSCGYDLESCLKLALSCGSLAASSLDASSAFTAEACSFLTRP